MSIRFPKFCYIWFYTLRICWPKASNVWVWYAVALHNPYPQNTFCPWAGMFNNNNTTSNSLQKLQIVPKELTWLIISKCQFLSFLVRSSPQAVPRIGEGILTLTLNLPWWARYALQYMSPIRAIDETFEMSIRFPKFCFIWSYTLTICWPKTSNVWVWYVMALHNPYPQNTFCPWAGMLNNNNTTSNLLQKLQIIPKALTWLIISKCQFLSCLVRLSPFKFAFFVDIIAGTVISRGGRSSAGSSDDRPPNLPCDIHLI
jgi:hypothetical protein